MGRFWTSKKRNKRARQKQSIHHHCSRQFFLLYNPKTKPAAFHIHSLYAYTYKSIDFFFPCSHLVRSFLQTFKRIYRGVMGSAWAREEEDYSAFYIPTVFCVFVLLLFPFVVFFRLLKWLASIPPLSVGQHYGVKLLFFPLMMIYDRGDYLFLSSSS